MTKITPLADSASLLFAQTPAAPPAGGFMGTQAIFIILMFGAMYFFMIAPQRKKQKELQKQIDALATGDEVLTIGGIYGEVTNKKEDRFIVRIAEGTKIEVAKSAISAVVRKAGEDKK
jgi:preprotein translocase subunit YajC